MKSVVVCCLHWAWTAFQVWSTTSSIGSMLTWPRKSGLRLIYNLPAGPRKQSCIYSKRKPMKKQLHGISSGSAPQGLRHVYSHAYLPNWAQASTPNNCQYFVRRCLLLVMGPRFEHTFLGGSLRSPYISKMATFGPLHRHFRLIASFSFLARSLSPGPWQVGIRRPAAGLDMYLYIYVSINQTIYQSIIHHCMDHD